MILLSQTDARWTNVNLGKTKFPIGKIGCTITCISMVSDYYSTVFTGCVNTFKTPDQLAKQFQFTDQGLILWASMKNVVPFHLEKRLYTRNDFEIQESLKDPKKTVILNINHGTHWVVAVKKSLIGNGYIVYDPWGGVKRTISLESIVGSAHFILN